MKYKEFTVHTTDEAEELVGDIFWNYSDYGVAVSSLKDVIELTEKRSNTYDYLDDKLLEGVKGVSLVKGYFDIDDAQDKKSHIIEDLETLKLNADGNLSVGSLELIEREVDGDDWIEIWRKHYRPINFGKITVCPKWLECKTDNKVVYIDSNAAFGTGEHETTSMCIDFLEKYLNGNMTVVDVGTGSGILGIAAAKLGANKVILTDIDPVAVSAATHNVEINEVKGCCTVYNTNLLDGVVIEGDMVVANITADVLKILASDVTKYVKVGGVLILSGILNALKQSVVSTYNRFGFTLLEEKTVGEWTALVMKR